MTEYDYHEIPMNNHWAEDATTIDSCAKNILSIPINSVN